jgi:hypothetical protein
LENLIKSTYGQIGERRIIFLIAYNYYIRDLTMKKYRTRVKLDFDKYNKVPLPHSFYKHIQEIVLKNTLVKEHKEISNLYLELLH